MKNIRLKQYWWTGCTPSSPPGSTTAQNNSRPSRLVVEWFYFSGVLFSRYKIILDSDDSYFGGHNRNDHSVRFFTQNTPWDNRRNALMVSCNLFYELPVGRILRCLSLADNDSQARYGATFVNASSTTV